MSASSGDSYDLILPGYVYISLHSSVLLMLFFWWFVLQLVQGSFDLFLGQVEYKIFLPFFKSHEITK